MCFGFLLVWVAGVGGVFMLFSCFILSDTAWKLVVLVCVEPQTHIDTDLEFPHTFYHSHTLGAISNVQFANKSAHLWDVEGNLSTQEKHVQSHRERANSIKTEPELKIAPGADGTVQLHSVPQQHINALLSTNCMHLQKSVYPL